MSWAARLVASLPGELAGDALLEEARQLVDDCMAAKRDGANEAQLTELDRRACRILYGPGEDGDCGPMAATVTGFRVLEWVAVHGRGFDQELKAAIERVHQGA